MEKEIKELTKEEMLNPGFIPSVLEYCDTIENKEEVINELMTMAKQHRIVSTIKNQITTWNNKRKLTTNNVVELLEFTEHGQVAQTTTNYVTILENDPEYRDLFLFDEFKDTAKQIVRPTPTNIPGKTLLVATPTQIPTPKPKRILAIIFNTLLSFNFIYSFFLIQ